MKEKELREDIAVLSQAFARVLDCKDSVIEVSEGVEGGGGAVHGPPG